MNWQQWKTKYQKELQHIAGYEEMFVDRVLSRIPNLRPTDVIPQYHFVDGTGKNRYIDFLIYNKQHLWALPIELDGYSKMVGNGQEYEVFQDFLFRQNAIIQKFKVLLRYTNKDMFNHPDRIVKEISQTLREQTRLRTQLKLDREKTQQSFSQVQQVTYDVKQQQQHQEHWFITLLLLPIRCIKLLGKATGIIGDTINQATHELNKSLDEVQENIYYNLARQELEEENLLPKRDLTNIRHSETEKQLIRLRVAEIKERKRLTGSIIKQKK